MTPETATYLDGPGLVEWLERHHILIDRSAQVGHDDECRIRRWEAGTAASVYTVDRILCKLGVCLGELPDSLYRERPKVGGSRRIDSKTKRRMVRLFRQGKNYAEIGRELGVCQKTAAKHVKAGAA